MALLNQKGFERKLQQMSSAQDSVQTVSLWIIHHKKYATDIVRVWMEYVKRCNPDRRLVMLYLANDVLQNSRKKGKEFSTAFSKVLKEAVPLLCERKIIDSVQRVIKIWHERKVFEKDFLESLQRKFDSSQLKSKKVTRRRESNGEETPVEHVRHASHQHAEKRLPPADFKPQHLIDALKSMRDFQAEVTLKESQLNSLRIDASDMEAIKQLKDRATGAKFTLEYETASENLDSFCETLKQEKEEISKLIQILDDGKSFYDSAFGEVKVIVHAYKTFGNRLNSLKKKVDHKVAKIINAEAEKEKMGPITTPQASFLTSGLPDISSSTPSSTPPQKTEESEGDKTEKVTDTTVDNTEVADMDIEDEADSENGEISETPSETASTPSTESKTSETTKSEGSLQTQVTMTTVSASVPCSSEALSQTSNINTSMVFTGTSSAMPVQVPVPQQMVMPQPNMQFIPGQPGMQMMPVGMHGTGQFIAMPSQYGQPMVQFGMPMHGMNTFPGSVQPHMTGLLPGQSSFPGQNIGLVSNFPQQIQSNVSVPQMPLLQEVPVQAGQAQSLGQATTTTVSSVMPQVSHSTTNLSTSQTKPLPSNIPPTDVSEVRDSTHESMDSPSSEASAPSPIGSPELELGGDETPETASPQGISNVKIIGFPSLSTQSESTPAKESLQGTVPSEGTSGTSTGSATPNRTNELSKPVSAVNILAQLISRGRKLKEQTPEVDTQSEASTPKEEAVEVSQPQQGKPLFSLIDSLFPKLTDSLKTIREREKDNETSTSTSEEGSPKQKIEINSMEDDHNDPEPEAGSHNPGTSLEQADNKIEHRVLFKGSYHQTPTEHPQERPVRPYGHEGPVRQPWNNVPFQGHPRGPPPPVRQYQERPHVPPSSPLKGPGHSPCFPGPQRPFEGTPSAPFGPSSQVEYIDPEGMRDEYRPGPERSPHQLHSPRSTFASRPSPGSAGGYPMERASASMHPDDPPINGSRRSPRGSFVGVGPQHLGPQDRGHPPNMHPDEPPTNGPPISPRGSFVGGGAQHLGPQERGNPANMHPDEPPLNGPPRSPRGTFVGGPQHLGPQERRPHVMPREDQRPRFQFDGPRGTHPHPPGPTDVFGGPGGSPRPSPIDGPPHPRWRGPQGPRGPLPPPPLHEGHPRGFQRPHSESRPGEMGEPPIKRPMMEEGRPQPYPETGRPVRFPHEERIPIDRNREIWRERDPSWDSSREPHLGPRPDRGRLHNEFPEREEHLPPRFIEQENPFPHERLGFPPPRRNSFKGYDENEFHRREHYMQHRPRLPFPGSHPRPYF